MTDFDTLIFAHPAAVRARKPTSELLALAKDRHAIDPSIFEEIDPFFWDAEISSSRLDSYFTYMARSTLENFAADAQAGVSFQNSHQWRALGFGRSLAAEIESIPDVPDGLRVIASFYTIPGLRLNDVSTSDLIAGIRSGLVKDVSVGFYGGEFRCSICGRDMLRDWDCRHIPGFKYEIQEEGEEKKEVIATARVEGAHLSEVSAVYDGATPGAAVLKAERMAEAGMLKPEAARIIEARYRVNLPVPATARAQAPRHAYAGWEPPAELVERVKLAFLDPHNPKLTGRSREESERIEALALAISGAFWEGMNGAFVTEAEFEQRFRDALQRAAESAPDQEENDPPAPGQRETDQGGERMPEPNEFNEETRSLIVQRLKAAGVPDVTEDTVLAGVDWLVREVERLKPLAVDGEQYRRDLVAEALTEGARAMGEAFDENAYRALLENAPIAQVKRLRDDWRAVGDRLFAGGRQSKEEDAGAEERKKPNREVPDGAYKA